MRLIGVSFIKWISFFNKGISSANFRSLGNMPLFKESLIISVRNGKYASIESIKILAEMQKIMADFCYLDFL